MDLYYWRLVKSFAWTDFKLKYQGSILGYLWSLLNPLLTFAILYIVFYYFIRFQIEYYPLFLFLGIILWGFFNEGTFNALTSLDAKASIMKKIAFPRTVVVVASNLTTFLGLLLNFLVFLLFALLSDLSFHFSFFLSILFFIPLILFTLGISFLVAALNLRFTDIQHIWRILLQLFFWMTPVVYPLTMIPLKLKSLIYFNPLALLLEGLRNLFLHNEISYFFFFISLGTSLFIFFIGFITYKKMSNWFAEWA